MNIFPINKKPSAGQYTEALYKPVIKHEFESNYVMSRPKSTRARRKFKLGWLDLTDNEMNLIEQFFVDNQGSAFEYTTPFNQTYTVLFGSDTLPEKKPYKTGSETMWTFKGLVFEEQ